MLRTNLRIPDRLVGLFGTDGSCGVTMSSWARFEVLSLALGRGLRRSLIQEPTDSLKFVRRPTNKMNTTGSERHISPTLISMILPSPGLVTIGNSDGQVLISIKANPKEKESRRHYAHHVIYTGTMVHVKSDGSKIDLSERMIRLVNPAPAALDGYVNELSR